MFVIGTKASGEDEWTEHVLLPPSNVDYPAGDDIRVLTTLDGAAVVQRPLLDSRPRRWIWRNLPMRDSEYSAQWDLLRTFGYKYRLSSGLYPFVGVWEDETGAGGLDRMDGGNRVFTPVKIVQVARIAEPNFYPETYIEFYLRG